eukprot:g8449.t1
MSDYDSSANDDAAAATAAPSKRRNLSQQERRAALDDLLALSTNGELHRGDLGVVGEKFGTTRHSMARLWKQYKKEKADGVPNPGAQSRRAGRAGRKPMDLTPFIEALRNIPLKLRTTQRSIAAAIGMKLSTFHNHMEDLGVKPHSRFLKPLLTTAGKKQRLRWARRWTAAAAAGTRKFHGMGNIVHVDEKWFYICKDGQKYYLFDDENPPSRKVQHKSHITKVMFLGVVARPRRNTANNSSFSGKIGIYPFTEKVRAQRHSRNRPAGALETKTVEVTKERYKKMMIDKVIPDIKRQFPRPPAAASPEDRIVWVQQDNARPHRINDDPELRAAMSADGWDIRLINQPDNSPDTNILDLGFFNSIQSLQDRTCPRTVDELVTAVEQAWAADPPKVLNRVWLSLQACLEQIMLAGGDNDYKLPHIGKAKLERAGTLPWQLECSDEAWAKSTAALAELEAAEAAAAGGGGGASGSA